MSCKVINPANGKESELRNQLLKVLGTDQLADRAYSKVHQPQFLEDFGDWIQNYKDGLTNPSLTSRISESGEPTLYKDTSTGQHFFKKGNGERIFIDKISFPDLEIDEINDISKYLLYEFIYSNKNKSLNNINAKDLVNKNILPSIEKSAKQYADLINDLSVEEIADSFEISIDEANQEKLRQFNYAKKMLEYKDDFKINISDMLSDLGMSRKEEIYDENGNIIDEGVVEEEKSEGLNIKEKFFTDSKDTASVNTKIFLSQIPMSTENSLLVETFADFDTVWSTLKPILSDTVGFGTGGFVQDVYELMIEKIRHLSKSESNLWLSPLADRMNDLSDYRKNEFVQAFSDSKIEFYVTELGGEKYNIINATSTNSRRSQYLDLWGTIFKDNHIHKGNLTKTSRDQIQIIYDHLKDLDASEDNIPDLIESLSVLGINISMNDLKNFHLLFGGDNSFYIELDRLFTSTKFLFKKILDPDTKFVEDRKNKNPFIEELALKHLADTIAFDSPDIASESIVSNKGKSYYTFTKPSLIHNKLNMWTAEIENKDPNDNSPTELEQMSYQVGKRNSRFIKYLLAEDTGFINEEKKAISLNRLNSVKATYFNSIKSKGKNDGVSNTQLNKQDAYNDSVYKTLMGLFKPNTSSLLPTITPADKSKRIELSGLPVYKTNIKRNEKGEYYIPERVIDIFVDYFEDEYNRMKVVSREIKELPESERVENYHNGNKNGLKSQIFPEFSHDSKSEEYADLIKILYKEGGVPLSDDTTLGLDENQKAALREAIRKDISFMVEFTRAQLEELSGMSSDMVKYYKEQADDYLSAIAGDYFVNGLISNIEFSKLFLGDFAYFKDMPDMVARVPGVFADGAWLRLKNDDNLFFNASVIDDIVVDSSYIHKIKNSLDKKDQYIADIYKNINITDGQGWITPRRWKFLLERIGKFQAQELKVYNKMMSGRPLSPKEMKVAAQPIKGVYYQENDGRPVYFKYSQFVLIPSAVKGTSLEPIYNKMTINPETGKEWEKPKDELHEVIAISGVKVGAKGVSKITKEGTKTINSDFVLNPMQLSNRGWRLQTEVPTKLMYQMNLATQVQKNILLGIKKSQDRDYVFNGENVDGDFIEKRIHETISTLSNMGKNNIKEKFQINENNKILNTDALYEALIKEFKNRNYDINVIGALQKRIPFDAIPNIKNKIQPIFMSILNKEMAKVKTNGGSYVQVSPFGLETIGDTSNIKIVSDNYDGKGLQPPRIEKGVFKPGQILLPHSQLIKLLRDNSITNYSTMTGDEIKKLIDPSVLQAIGYRIPNQGLSSTDAFEIVGFLPEGVGDSIIAYDAFTQKTGSDFDIDKLYMMFQNLEYKDGKITRIAPDPSSNDKHVVQNRLFDLYYSVLTGKGVYDKLMKSIDSKFLKNDIESLFPSKEFKNLEFLSPLKQIDIRFDYFAGKTGVSKTALQMTDHAIGKMAGIGLWEYIGIGSSIPIEISIYGMKTIEDVTQFDTDYKNSKETIADRLSMILNAFVDIKKDPYISRGNYNDVTINHALMLVRANVDMAWINRFIGQPILREYAQAKMQLVGDNKSKTSDALYLRINNKNVKFKDPAEYIRAKHGFDGIGEGQIYSKEKLENYIKSNSRNKVFDQGVFDYFMSLNKPVSILANSALASKADVKGGTGTFTSRLVYENQVESVKGLRGFKNKFNGTALGTYHDNAVVWAGDVIQKSDLFLTGSIGATNMYNTVSRRLGRGDLILNEDLARSIEKSLYSYLLSKTKLFDGKEKSIGKILNTIPDRVDELQKELAGSNFFISELFPYSVGERKFIGINSKNRPKSFSNKMYRSWLDLYLNPETEELAIDLVKYAYFQSGFQNNLKSFFEHIPHEILTDHFIVRDIKNLFNEQDSLEFDDNFLDQFVRHEFEQSGIVRSVNKRYHIRQKGYYSSIHGVVLDIDMMRQDNKDISVLRKDDKNNTYYEFPEYIKSTFYTETGIPYERLYKFHGVKEPNSKDKSISPVYYRVSPLGLKDKLGKVYEYKYNEKVEKSIIPENRISNDVLDKIEKFKKSVFTESITDQTPYSKGNMTPEKGEVQLSEGEESVLSDELTNQIIDENTVAYQEDFVEDSNEIVNKDEVSLLFNENKELSKIGTQEQYIDYLNTIFPQSTVNDILYHGTGEDFEDFSFNVKSKFDLGTKGGEHRGMFWFTTYESAKKYAAPIIETIPKGEPGAGKTRIIGYKTIPVLLNMKNPAKEAALDLTEGEPTDTLTKEDKKILESQGFDSAMGYSMIDMTGEWIVFNPDQIHILGSKKDIDGFKNFINNQIVNKDGVSLLFNENKELSKVGTEEQYINYLNTIFPESKVKRILYHGSSQFGFDQFSKEKLGEFTGAGSAKLGFFFSDNLENSFSSYTLNINKDVSFSDEGRAEGVEGTLGLSEIDSLLEDLDQGFDFKDNEIRNKEYFIKSITKSGSTSYHPFFETKKEALENYKNDDFYNPNNKIEVIEKPVYGKYIYSKFKESDKSTSYYKKEIGIGGNRISISEKEYNEALNKRKDFLLKERANYIKDESKNRVYKVLLNSKNLKEFDDKGNRWREETYVDRIKQTLSENKDSLVIKNTYDPLLNDVYVVFEPEQIHILGNKKDIDGFKNFINNQIEDSGQIRLDFDEERGEREVETIDIFNKKVEYLKGMMNVEVVFDESVPTSRVLPASDPRVEAAGKPVILINPKRLFKTTAIHEFAHIFIDSFPKGMENKRLKRAVEDLYETDLYYEVRELYPDLINDKERFDKELLTTAIGLKGAEIWNEVENQTKWEAFKNWFFDFIRKIFGLKRDRVLELTREMLNEKVEKDMLIVSNYTQEERTIDDEFDEVAFNDYTNSLDRIYDEALARITNLYSYYDPASVAEERKSKEASKAGLETRYDKLTKLKTSLERYDTVDKLRGIGRFLTWSNQTLNGLSRQLKEDALEDNISQKTIHDFYEINAVFDLVEDIKNLIIKSRQDKEITARHEYNLLSHLNRILTKKNDVNSMLLAASKNHFARVMATHSNRHETIYRNKFEKKWEDINPNATKAERDEQKNVWVQERMELYKDEIYEKALKESSARAEESIGDITAGAGLFMSEKTMNSNEIQVFSTLVDGKEQFISDYANSNASIFEQMHKEYLNEISGSSNNAKKYEKMLDYSKVGDRYYFAGEYKADFIETYYKKREEYGNSDYYRQFEGRIEVFPDKRYKDGRAIKYSIDGGPKKTLRIENQKKKIIKGDTVTYWLRSGQPVDVHITQAVAMSEFTYWLDENTMKKSVGSKTITVPTDEWLNPDYKKLSATEKKHLDFFKRYTNIANNDTNNTDSLIRHYRNAEFMMLPSVLASTLDRVSQGKVKGAVKDWFKDIVKVREDEFEFQPKGEKKKTDDFVRVFADVSNREKLRVPIPFRGKLDSKDQSLDLHTIVLMNLVKAKNYKEKKDIEALATVMLEVMKERESPRLKGIGKKQAVHGKIKDKLNKLFKEEEDIPNDYKALKSVVENRIFGIKHKSAGEIAGMDINKLTNSWLKYAGQTSLILNWANSFVNFSVGSSANLIEAVGGEVFNLRDLKNASLIYWKDMRNIVNDWGANVEHSRTNRFINFWNVMGDKKYLNNNFEENVRVKSLFKTNNLRPFARGGEHMMQSQVMYATLLAIKIIDKKGRYLNAEGKVVSSKKDAASLNDVIYFDKHKRTGALEMKMPDWVTSTTFSHGDNTHQQIFLETRNLIKKKIIDLHGIYDSDLQSAGQRYFWGKLLFFLRKWIEPGFHRRWRGFSTIMKNNEDMRELDKYYSEDLKSYQTGYYVTALRFLGRLRNAIKENNFELIKNDNLMPHEKANLRKFMAELSITSLTYIAYQLLGGSDDDDNLALRYGLRRHVSEMLYFASPLESWKIATTPTASMGMGKRILGVLAQFMHPQERYENGPNKDRLKLSVKALKTLPIMAQLEKDLEAQLRFLSNF